MYPFSKVFLYMFVGDSMIWWIDDINYSFHNSHEIINVC